MADAFGNMLASSIARKAQEAATGGDKVASSLQAINADLQKEAGIKSQAVLNERLMRGMTVPEWQVAGPSSETASITRNVAPSFRYQSADEKLWVEIPQVTRSTVFTNLAAEEKQTAVPNVVSTPDVRTSQYFMQQWEHAYRYNLSAPTQANWSYLENRRQALDDVLRPAYNTYASERIAFARSQMPQPTTRRYMTNAEFSEWRKQDNINFLKFVAGSALMGVLPAVATASPLAGAAMSGWSVGSSANSFNEGNYVQGALELAGGLLGLGVASAQIRSATTLKQAMYMPLGPNGAPGALVEVPDNIRPPNLTERGTLANLRPQDLAVSQRPARSLVQDSSGRYWLESAGGNRITPSGSYDFVTLPDGRIRVARSNINPDFSTHLGLSSGGEVSYAGSIRFGNNMGPNRGSIIQWTNNSGHYQPPAYLRNNSGLPNHLFRAH